MSAAEILNLIWSIVRLAATVAAIAFALHWLDCIRRDVRSIRDNVAQMRWKEEDDS